MLDKSVVPEIFRVLIATPIHESKDYCMERWLQNVAELIKVTPSDVLLVDNSSSLSYVKKIKNYLKKFQIQNSKFKILHLELPDSMDRYERIARSREAIRQEVIKGNYVAWFSWENDQIIPTDSLAKLSDLMKKGNFMVVDHDCVMRTPETPNAYCVDFGVSLISREALAKYGFILNFGTDPEMPTTWKPSEAWFKKQVLRDGGSCLEVEGLLKPVYHLDDKNYAI